MSCSNKAEPESSPVEQSQRRCKQQSYCFDQMDASRDGFSWMILDSSGEHLGKDYKRIFQKVISKSLKG